MAFLAPIAGGGLFGGAFGNIALAALGIGIQLAAAYFFPQKVKGPRAESTKAQTSKYGDYIGRVHGHGRTAGAAIWLKNDKVDEHKETERQGGKALGPEVTTYTYTFDAAFAFAWNGPAAAIPRMWADDKLILDNSAESLEEMLNGETFKAIGVAKGARIKIYLGTADQTPDPDIEADRGVDNVPAWPGLVYVVIKNFPLDEFGIRLPNIEAEVVMAGEERFISTLPVSAYGGIDLYNNTYLTGDGLGHFQIFTMPGFVPAAIEDIGGAFGCRPIVSKTGDIILTQQTSVFFQAFGEIYIYDGQGGGLKQSLQYTPRTGLNTLGAITDVVIDGVNYAFISEAPDLTMITFDGMEWAVNWTAAVTGGQGTAMPLAAGPELLYMIKTDNSIHTVDWSAGTPTAWDPVSPPGLLGSAIGVTWDEEVDGVYILTTAGVFLYSNELDELIASNTDATFFAGISSTAQLIGQARIEGSNSTIVIRNNGTGAQVNDVLILQKADLTEVDRIDFDVEATPGWTNVGLGGDWRADPIYGMLLATGVSQSIWFLPRIARERIPLAEIIQAECDYAGLPCDVTGITGDVEGYVVRDNAPPRGVLEDLARVKFFDFTQANGVAKFFMRQSSTMATALTIPADLGFAEGSDPDPKFVREEYLDFREVPHRVVLSYNAVEADYRTGAQSNTPPNPNKKVDDEWPEFPVPPPVEIAAPAGQNEGAMPFEFQTSLAMTDDEAAQTVDIFYNELLDAVSVYHTTVGPKFLRTHPGDVVALDLDFDRLALGSVITRMEGDLAITLDLLRRTTIYTSDAVGVPTPNNPQSLLGISRIAPIFIDGHLMRAEDDSNAFYVGVYPAERGNFSSGTIYKSTDLGNTYNPWLGFTTATMRGMAQEALPAVDHPECWDYANSITFHVISDSGVPSLPSSVTEEQLLADNELNAFAVRSADGEWEYIQAANAIENSDGTWSLSSLLRGRKGTDFAMAGHAIGDPVVYLSTSSIDRPPEGEKDLARRYAAIATSTTFTSQYAVNFTNTARGWRPWAPWGVTGARDASGNLTIDWFRRDRLGQEWPEGGPEDPPMSETVEDYDVFIYDISGGVVRTIPASTSTASYSAADQTTDFGAPVAVGDLMVGVVQNSTTYGAGLERLAQI